MPLIQTKGAGSAQGFGLFTKPAAKTTSWLGSFGDSGTNYGYAVTFNSSGNVYLAGNNSNPDFQLVKYNSTGVVQWQKSLDSGGNDYGRAVDVDSADNIYVCGTTNDYDTQIVKYNSSGVVQWQRRLSNGFNDSTGYAIAIDSSDNVLIGGYYNLSGTYGFQTTKYNSSGALQWQRRLVGTNAIGYGIAVDSSNNVYITGQIASKIQIAKYNSAGTIQWQRSLAGSSVDDRGRAVAVDSSGNIYICGDSYPATKYRLQLAKYNSSGTIQWQRTLSDTNSSYGLSIAVDSSSNIYVSGGYEVSPAAYDVIIAKYNSSGTIQWQRGLAVVGAYATADFASGIAVDNAGKFSFNGHFNAGGTIKFLFAKLPDDGTLTGAYAVGSDTFTYSTTTLTDAASTLTDAATTLTDSASTLTDASTSYTAATTTFTSTVTNI